MHCQRALVRTGKKRGAERISGLQTHSRRLSHVTGMFLPPGLSSTSLSSRDRAVKFSMTMSEKMARVTPAMFIFMFVYMLMIHGPGLIGLDQD